MAEEAAKVSDTQVVDGRLVCCRDDKRQVRTSEMGMHALSEIFSISTNPGEGSWWLYYLYALERVGRLTGQRLIAGHDWYREGCDLIAMATHGHGFLNDVVRGSVANEVRHKSMVPVLLVRTPAPPKRNTGPTPAVPREPREGPR